MSGYLNFFAGDYTGKYSLWRTFKGKELVGPENLKLADIAGFEVITEESVKKTGGTLGTAAVGGLLFGGAGAVVGALAGGNKNESVVEVTCFDGKKGLARADSEMMDTLRKVIFERNLHPQNSTKNTSSKSKWIAFFLCLFLGVLGAHKFYEGRVWWGVLYLFTYGLCFIGIIVDLIAILCKTDPYVIEK
jgi:hypothetical protein